MFRALLTFCSIGVSWGLPPTCVGGSGGQASCESSDDGIDLLQLETSKGSDQIYPPAVAKINLTITTDSSLASGAKGGTVTVTWKMPNGTFKDTETPLGESGGSAFSSGDVNDYEVTITYFDIPAAICFKSDGWTLGSATINSISVAPTPVGSITFRSIIIQGFGDPDAEGDAPETPLRLAAGEVQCREVKVMDSFRMHSNSSGIQWGDGHANHRIFRLSDLTPAPTPAPPTPAPTPAPPARISLTIMTDDSSGSGALNDVFISFIVPHRSVKKTTFLLDQTGVNDFGSGAVTDFVVVLEKFQIPEKVCFQTDGWTLGSAQINSISLSDGSEMDADIEGFGDAGPTVFDGSLQCRNLVVMNKFGETLKRLR